MEEEEKERMIEALGGFPANVVAVRASGHVSRSDYDKVLVPKVEQVFGGHDKADVYYEVGGDFAGFEPGAMWSDFKIGMGHFTGWRKIAVVTDIAWLRHAAEFLRFMVPVEVKLFGLAEADVAKEWISASVS
jgi:hypothetical protein